MDMDVLPDLHYRFFGCWLQVDFFSFSFGFFYLKIILALIIPKMELDCGADSVVRGNKIFLIINKLFLNDEKYPASFLKYKCD